MDIVATAMLQGATPAISPTSAERVRGVITRTLEKHPGITLSMLATHVRPFDKAWRVVLETMVAEGAVARRALFKGTRATLIYLLPEQANDGHAFA